MIRWQIDAELARYRQHLEEQVAERTRQLSEAKEAAEAANRAKSAFLANMSHEIRTPLHAITGMAYLIRRAGLNGEQNNRMGQLESAADHLLGIINNILDLSKIEAERLELLHEQVDIRQVVAKAQSMVEARAREKGLSVGVEISVLPHPLYGDGVRLLQVLLNYLGNAVKFTETGSVSVRVHAAETDERSVLVHFSVQDTGVGIEQNVLSRLFTLFEQGDNSDTRKYGGTGLGLAINQRLAELMGGQVGVSSQPGVGSTFWFTARLARHASMAVEVEEDPGAHKPVIRPQARILVVDDDELNREISRGMLEEQWPAIELAVDGQEAVNKVSAQPFDLILMDVQMPVLDGLEATRLIRQLANGRTVPIIAMTANAFLEDQRACLLSGMNDYLPKPVDPEHLLKVVGQWLSRSL